MNHIPERELAERPYGYQGPNLSPVGLKLLPQELAPGVLALMANLPPKDNNGLIVGEHSALVVDAGITSEVSRQIQQLAAELTDRPVRYLANTTYHGDHTFGNAAFPPDVDQVWRLPDVAFESFAEVDLGGRTVELWHFGPGNGPGDTIVYVPEARTAWTGNFLCAAGTAHMLLQGGPEPYIESLSAIARVELEGPMTNSPSEQFLERFAQAWSQSTPLHAVAAGNIRIDGVRGAAELFVPAGFMQRIQELGRFTEVHLREESA